MNKTLGDLQAAIGEWGDETFGKGDRSRAVLAHFFEEVVELAQSEGMLDVLLAAGIDSHETEPNPEKSPEEAADCAILLLQFAHRRGFSLSDAVEEKHTLNKARKWGPPDENGVCHHEKGATE